MIREIKSEDLETIYIMGKEYEENFDLLYDIKSYLNNDIYILKCYEEDNKIKGFIIANKLYENVEILLIYVDKKYRKCGIASSLLRDLEENTVDNLWLEVSVENKPALALYKKNGFNIHFIRKKYYKGIDAYVMKKVL